MWTIGLLIRTHNGTTWGAPYTWDCIIRSKISGLHGEDAFVDWTNGHSLTAYYEATNTPKTQQTYGVDDLGEQADGRAIVIYAFDVSVGFSAVVLQNDGLAFIRGERIDIGARWRAGDDLAALADDLADRAGLCSATEIHVAGTGGGDGVMRTYPGLASIVQDGEVLWVGEVSMDTGPNMGLAAPIILSVRAMDDERYVQLAEIDTQSRVWVGKSWPDESRTVIVRPTIEDDAVSVISMSGMPRVPMPLDVIAAIHANNGGEFTVPTLYALSDDDGFVVTMMLTTGIGIFTRRDGDWHVLLDDEVDGLTVNEVGGEAFRRYEAGGQPLSPGWVAWFTARAALEAFDDVGVVGRAAHATGDLRRSTRRACVTAPLAGVRTSR